MAKSVKKMIDIVKPVKIAIKSEKPVSKQPVAAPKPQLAVSKTVVSSVQARPDTKKPEIKTPEVNTQVSVQASTPAQKIPPVDRHEIKKKNTERRLKKNWRI